jgi:Ca2+-dependent lipid-binding protein
MKLALTVIQASNLPLRSNGDRPYAYITGKMLFEDRGFDMFETKVIHSSNPVYNETFVFHEVETVDVLHLEVLLWDKKQTSHANTNNSLDDSE